MVLKILPAHVSSDAGRLARMEREARVLATLNHPHIAAIYGLEDGNGTRALILELVEGPTLAERLHAGAIPIRGAPNRLSDRRGAGRGARERHRQIVT